MKKGNRRGNLYHIVGGAFLLFFTGLLLTGCKPTPKEPVMVNRSEGIPTDSIIEPLSGNELKKSEVPSKWCETINKGGGRVQIDADIEIQLPSVKNTSVIEVEKQKFTDKKLKEWERMR